MNTVEEIKALTDVAEGYVVIPEGDSFPECLTNTDDLQEVRARVLALHPSLIQTADGLAHTGLLLTETIRELDVLVKSGRPVTPEQLKEICFDVRLATVHLSSMLGEAIVGQGSSLYRGFADMISDAEIASDFLTQPLADHEKFGWQIRHNSQSQ